MPGLSRNGIAWVLVILAALSATGGLVSFRVRTLALDTGIFEEVVERTVADPSTTTLLRDAVTEVLVQGVDAGFATYAEQLANVGVNRSMVDTEIEVLADRTSESPVLREEFARALRQSHRYAVGESLNPATVNSEVFAGVLETEARRLTPALGQIIEFDASKLHIQLPRPRQVGDTLETLRVLAIAGPVAGTIALLLGISLHPDRVSVIRFLGRWHLGVALLLTVFAVALGAVWNAYALDLPLTIPTDAVVVYRQFMWGPALAVGLIGISCALLAAAFTEDKTADDPSPAPAGGHSC